MSQLHNAHRVDLDVQDTDTVASIKTKIQEVVGVWFELQDLLVDGASLSDESMLPALLHDSPSIQLAVKLTTQQSVPRRGRRKR